MKKLSIQEEEAMLAIWKSGGGYIRDIREHLHEQNIPYTTLASTVKNLERKEYVRSSREGNTNRYEPAISQEAYKKNRLRNLVSEYFKDSYKEMVTFFAREEQISPEELEEVIDMIKHKKSD